MRVNGKKSKSLRSGYTTGACAAAAAQAATIALLEQKTVDCVDIELPGSGMAGFTVEECLFTNHQASCSVIKDAGDDPDVTHGAEIWATVSWKGEPGVEIKGGKGVGLVTKPGLEVPVGSAAINPVPLRMITGSVRRAAATKLDGRGMQIVISVPKGEALARRTLNPRLGIVGGISILGTTGVVIPYSVNAYTACISQSLDVAVACDCWEVVLTTGRRSEKFAQRELALAEECFVQAGDFIGFSLKETARRHLTKVTVWGMPGKISKLATGHLYTNISDSRVDMGFLTSVAAGCGVAEKEMAVLGQANTATHFRQLLPPQYIAAFDRKLCLLAATKCRESIEGKLEIECIMTDFEGTILGRAHVAE